MIKIIMRYVKKFIRIPQKVVNNYTKNTFVPENNVESDDSLLYLLGVGVILNVGILFKIRENYKEDKLKNEIYNEIYKRYKL